MIFFVSVAAKMINYINCNLKYCSFFRIYEAFHVIFLSDKYGGFALMLEGSPAAFHARVLDIIKTIIIKNTVPCLS